MFNSPTLLHNRILNVMPQPDNVNFYEINEYRTVFTWKGSKFWCDSKGTVMEYVGDFPEVSPAAILIQALIKL